MTVDEAIQKANEGNVASMVALGDYYGQNEDYENALVWYRKAAELGNLDSMYKASLIDGMFLHASVIVSPNEDDDEYFREIDHYAGILKNYPQFKLEPDYSNSKYAYAESLYRRNKYTELFSLVRDESQARFRIMYANTLFAIGRNLSDESETERYYLNASQVIRSVLQANYIPEDSQYEQVRFVAALGVYASIIRIGLNKNADVAGSYQVLASQMDKLTNDDAKSLLSDQLSHYRFKKGIFGTSITYVD